MCRWARLGQVVRRNATVSMLMIAKLPLESATVSQGGGVSRGLLPLLQPAWFCH